MKRKLLTMFMALFVAVGFLSARTLYLDPGPWNVANAVYGVHAWGDGSNYDAIMTKVEGEENLYQVEVADAKTSIIYVRLSSGTTEFSWDNKWNQTGDITIPTDGTNKFTITDWDNQTTGWSTYTPPTPDPEPEDPDQPVDPEDPDQPVDPEDPDTPVDPEDPDTPVDPEDPDQPVDPEDPDQPVDPEDPDQPVDPEDPDTPVVPDPEEPAYTAVFIRGEFNEWGENYELTTTDGDYYVLEATFDLTGEFKIASSDWSTINYGGSYTISAGTEQILTKGSNDNMIADGTIAVAKVEFTVSTGTLLITAAQTPDPEDPDQPVDPEDPDQPVDPEDPDQPVDPEDPDTPVVPDPEEPEEPAGITFTVQVPEGTIECYVTGDPLWNTGDFLQMEKVEGEDNLFTITTTALKGTAWKYCSGPGWAYVEKDAQGNEILDRTAAGNPDVVAKWALLYEPDAEPIEPYYAIRGLVSWDMADDIKLTANAEGTEYSITGLDIAADKEFKVIYVDENVNITWYGVSALEANPEITQTGVDNIILAAGKYDIYFKTATKTMWIGLTSVDDPDQPVDPEDPDQPVDPEEPAGITFTVQVPEGTIECYVAGSPSWSFVQMEKVEGEENLFTVTTTELDGTAWKYASGPDWAYVEKDAQGGEVANRTEAGNPDVVASWLALYTPEVDPEDPDTPVDPEDPDQPVDPEDPDQPVDPEDPDQPIDPEEPAAITFTVQVPEGTIECYITGADLWNTGEFLQMEKVEGEDNLFTITTTALKGTQWKYASGPDWAYVEKDAQGGEVANRTEAGNPDVVASWLAVYDPEDEPTAVDEADALSIYAAEGTIYADAEIAIYTLAGVDVTAMNGSLYGTYIVKAENGATLINVW